ncbi:MAG: flippase [Ignavibacteria bacterium]|nr:flippase [Ignavibacteria bacterium]
MTVTTRIRKNTFYTTITIFSRLFANVFLFWFLARFYGPEQFGQFTFAHALATTFIILADFGLDVLLITEISAHSESRVEYIQKLIGIKLFFVVSAFVLMIFISQIFPLGKKAFNLILIFAFYLVFTSLNNFLFGIFRGYEKFSLESRVSVIINSLLVFVTVALIYLKSDLVIIAGAFCLTRFLGIVLSYIYLKRLDSSIKLKIDLSNLGLLKSKALIFGLHLVFSYLFFQIDTLLLAKIKGEYSVGIYQSVFKLIMLPLVVPDILINSFLPTLSRLYVEKKEDWLRVGSSMGRILFMVVIPISIILFVYADEIIHLIYRSDQFFDAIVVLKIFALILFVRFTLEPFALMLTTSNRQILRMYTVISATILNVIFNSIIIPKYDTKGAAIVSLVINSFVGIVYFLAMAKDFHKWLINIKNLVLIFLSLIVITLILNFLMINFVLQILIFITFYSLIIFFYFLNKDEKELIQSLVNKLRNSF